MANIREAIGELIGQSLMEITQHDDEYSHEKQRGFVDLMFSDGDVLRVYSLHTDEPMLAMNPTEDSETEIFGDGRSA
jgi:hypothetical protein